MKVYYSLVIQRSGKKSEKTGNQEKNSHEKNGIPKQKQIEILQGLKRKMVAEIYSEHQINQNLYYKWRDQFLANMDQVFIDEEKITEKLNSENKQFWKIIGDLSVELKNRQVAKMRREAAATV